MALILVTNLCFKALILQGEIWCWSFVGLKPVGDDRWVAKKTAFSPIPLLWTSFRLISKEWLKMSFAKKGIFPDNSNVIKQFFFCFSRMRTSQNLALFFCFFFGGGGVGESILICLSRTLFSFSLGSFVAHLIVLLLHGIGAGQRFRKGTNLIFKE